MDRSRPRSADIVLVGLMGAGKTTVAGALASRLGVRAGDSDERVEADSGHSIAGIFGLYGEAEFRRKEVAAVRTLLHDPDVRVIALGGGAFLTDAVRQACHDTGASTVYLHAKPEELVRRLEQTDLSTRPLLARDPSGTIERLYRERDPVYRRADRVVETEGRTVEEIVEEIVRG